MANENDAAAPGLLGGLLKNSDLLLALGIILVLAMMVLPVWTWTLNVGIAASVTVALLILLTVVYSPRAVDFAVFPSVLLMTTALRLALNVASTRKILLEGKAGVEGIITVFGDFVVGGNYVVGIIIFLVLVIIQLMVITKGATRIAEVAARFTLDAMPLKQMAIDGELQRGDITQEEAARKRLDLQRESNFYGAMDGAAKFVQGDVYAGLIIAGVNIVGGLAIGMWMRGEGLVEALQTYTLLTIGDGLAAQIPSLLIAVAAGLIVTRSTSDENLSRDLTKEMLRQPKALYVASGVLVALGVVPGMPLVPLWALAGFLGALARSITLRVAEEAAAAARAAAAPEPAAKPGEKPLSLLQVDPLELEIGYGLIALVNPQEGGDLLDRIVLLRRQCALDYGIIVPPVRMRDNIKLAPENYQIKVNNVEVAGSSLRAGKFLALETGQVTRKLKGEPARDPAFGIPGVWLNADERDAAEQAGYSVVDPPTIIATHLTEVIKLHAHELITLQDVRELLDHLKQDYPAVVDELLTVQKVSPMTLLQVLRLLLKEKVSIRNLVTIIEVICAQHAVSADPQWLAECVRLALAPQICAQHVADNGALKVLTFSPRVEQALLAGLRDGELRLPPDKAQKVLEALQQTLDAAAGAGGLPTVMVQSKLRVPVRRLLERRRPCPSVLAYEEILPVNISIESQGMIDAEV